ncbi:MAG TPA: Fe-S cluster assembly protein SufD [Bacteroidia bacterium]|nr:Fe-S cluster assembly protein SufD [Bacteroidia bacterium]
MELVTENINIKENFLQDFKIFSETLGKRNHVAIRKEAIENFRKAGFPTLKNEEWKYTDISPVLKLSLQNFQTENKLLSEKNISEFSISGNDSILIVMENGKFNAALSVNKNIPEGLIIQNFSTANHPEFEKHFAKYATHKSDSFVALNTAFNSDGVFVYTEPGVIIERPIHILHISHSENSVSYPRNLIVTGKNSQLKITSSFHSLNSFEHNMVNCVNEIVTEENSQLEFYLIQEEENNCYHFNNTFAHQEKNSTFNICTITLGGSIVRNNLNIVLNDQNCTSHLYGLYLLNENQLVDNHTLVDHAMPNCYSNELYKGLIDGKAKGVFNGKIFVRKDAQKTNAYQSNKNILLSDDASMNTKPQLEIYADDVKCSHGATTGQLDEEALFYMRARGIGESDAKALLNFAFAGDVIQNIKIDALKNNLLKLLAHKLNSHIEFDLN